MNKVLEWFYNRGRITALKEAENQGLIVDNTELFDKQVLKRAKWDMGYLIFLALLVIAFIVVKVTS